MQSKYVDALATLSAISGTAFAQSSVTISGRLNVASNSTTTTSGTAAGVTARDLTGGERTRTGGRLTFAGVEDLGGGLKAGFDYTANLYTGIAETMKTRRANVSLSGGFGTVAMGSFDSNALDAVRGFSPSTVGLPGGDFLGRNNFLAGATSNAVAYVLPAMGNLKTSVAVVNQSRVADPATPVTAEQKVAGFLLGAEYASGPLNVKFGHGNAKINQVVAAVAPATGAAGDFDKVTDTAIGASYDLGVAVPYLAYETSKASDQTGTGTLKTAAYEIGAKFPMGSLTPYASVSSAKLKSDGVSANKTSGYQVGATYDLSKRTSFYASMGKDQVKTAAGANATKRTGYGVGLIHMF